MKDIVSNIDNKDMKADLHIHTTGSDGTWPPAELVDNIKKSGIKLFAVTDHDNTCNIAETAKLAQENGIMFVPGVEINTTYREHNYHILGLGIDPENEELQKLLRRSRDLLLNLDRDTIRALERIYNNVSLEEFDRYPHPAERGGWRALNYIIDKGLCTNYREYFTLIDDLDVSLGKIEFPSPHEAINTISAAGGTAILAHPGASFYDKDYKTIVTSMLAEGIKGLECYHPDNSQEVTDYCLEVCREKSLLITGGSDCHGSFNPRRYLGNPDIRLSQLRLDDITVLK